MPTAFELLDKLDQFGWSQNFHENDFSEVMPLQHCIMRNNGPCTSKSPLQDMGFYNNQYTEISADDFGHGVNIGPEKLTDQQRLNFLNNFYIPPKPPLHEWPAEIRILNGKKIVRRLNPSFSERSDCSSMVYSPMYRGLFCRYCALFPPMKPQSANATFIKKPFVRFSHMFGNGGAVKKHINRKYHQEAEEQVNQFLERLGEQLRPSHR